MVDKSNNYNNTLNIFSLLNIKENLANKKIIDNKKLSIKKIWSCVQEPEIHSSEVVEILKDKYIKYFLCNYERNIFILFSKS